MKTPRKHALAAAAAAVLALSAAAPAAAAGLPVVYGGNDGWQESEVRPAGIYIGNGGSPWVSSLRWQDWTARTAYGRGILHIQNPACTPTYLCSYAKHHAGVWLHDVKTHAGQPYFADMNWSYNAGGKHHVVRLHVSHGYYIP
jgi:hypothetical protein